MRYFKKYLTTITSIRLSRFLKYWIPYIYLVLRYYFEVRLNRNLDMQIKHLTMILGDDIYWVKTEKIKYTLAKSPAKILKINKPWWKYTLAMDKIKKPWLVYDGEWDSKNLLEREKIFQVITDKHESSKRNKVIKIIHNSIHTIFVLKEDYKKSEQYKVMKKNIDNAVSMNNDYNCNTINDIEEYFEKLIEAFFSMKINGFLTQKELGGDNNDEIPIFIGRNGELCQSGGGQHRIRFAEILNIRYVPVNIRGFHHEFIKKLCKIYNLPPHKSVEKWIKNNSDFRGSVIN